jgi:Asp-tRNA(Asn)/Glu-tRNA(Gln) amidotransferase A subunit family amidase
VRYHPPCTTPVRVRQRHGGRRGAGEVGAEELLTAQLARLAAVDAVVHAIVHLDEAGARRAARAADAARAAGGPLGRLHGVPITVKDWIDVAGLPCSGGEAAHVGRVPATTPPRWRGCAPRAPS